MAYLLDTNALSHAIRYPKGDVARQMARRGTGLKTSTIVAAELQFGVAKNFTQNLSNDVHEILRRLEILPFDEPASYEYAHVRSELERKGTLIGSLDMLIAAHARSQDLQLVTHNTKEFQQVPNLKVTDWQE
jgi:tRNA(fMet)-specific endonuclease VapC